MQAENAALKVHERDNVATLFRDGLKGGARVAVHDKKGEVFFLVLKSTVPYGHKLALEAIGTGAPVYKYGEKIGVASCDIAAGEHVHVHNMESARGRGDWRK